jgi:hypothetical protein
VLSLGKECFGQFGNRTDGQLSIIAEQVIRFLRLALGSNRRRATRIAMPLNRVSRFENAAFDLV